MKMCILKFSNYENFCLCVITYFTIWVTDMKPTYTGKKIIPSKSKCEMKFKNNMYSLVPFQMR